MITASRYLVDNRPGGDVYWCASEPVFKSLNEEWAKTYGGSVVAGGGAAESEPDPRRTDHPGYGYPITTILDPVANASDDEIEYAITAFTPLPPFEVNENELSRDI